MPHSIFFRGGYAIHGSNATGALGRPASHGCVRLSPANAARLYQIVQNEGGNISITLNGPGGLYIQDNGGVVASNDTTNPLTATPTSGGTLTINSTATSWYGIQVPAGTFISYGAMNITARGAGA